MAYDSTYPLTEAKVRKTGTEFQIGLITDLDKLAKVQNERGDTVWKSLLMKGTLLYDHATKKVDINIQDESAALSLFSEYSRGGRGMELSELSVFNGHLYTVDDRTGIVYKISNEKAIPWALLADGDGLQDQGFKGEWMTVKNQELIVGGHGKEMLSRSGKVLNKNYQWVKIISKDGAVRHVDWSANYDAMRDKAGCPYPGYLTHESGEWSEIHQQWFFLPRKVSSEAYDYKLDESRTGNLLIRCSEDFKEIQVTEIGTLIHKTRGYSTFKFIPGTDDHVIVAIKSEEIGDDQKSFLTAFNIAGEVLMEDMEFSTTMKFEGIEFI